MNYELMVVTTAVSSTDPILAKIEKSVKEAGASGLKLEKLGKKALAYPIAKQTEGEYVLFNFEAPPEAIGVISKMLRLEREAILRYLILRVPRVSKVSRVSRVSEESTVDKKVKEEKPKAKVIVTTKTATTEGTDRKAKNTKNNKNKKTGMTKSKKSKK